MRRPLLFVFGLMFISGLSGLGAPGTTALRFTLGPEKPPTGYIQILPFLTYTKEQGYGFEPGSTIAVVDRGGSDPMRAGYATSDQPFAFSVALPEGNYNVTVRFGDRDAFSTNMVRAESRRLMLEDIRTAPGEFLARTFTVNIRTPYIAEGRSVRLKEREMGVLHWDDKLTIEFGGSRPAICACEISPATNAITVFLLGDSTVTDQPAAPWNSWGQMITRFFKPGVAVANHAESGESLKSSINARRVEKVLMCLKSGDYVLVQFGHNDQKDKATNAIAVYRANLEKLVGDVRARGATPVLVTSMERMAGIDKETLGEYPATVRQVAAEQKVALIDLNAMSRQLYRALGSNLKLAFQDGTHHNAYGSYELAKCVITGIRQSGLDLARFILDDVSTFDPAHPDPVCSPGERMLGAMP